MHLTFQLQEATGVNLRGNPTASAALQVCHPVSASTLIPPSLCPALFPPPPRPSTHAHLHPPQRLLKRPGGFTDPGGAQDRAALASAGVNLSGPAAAAKLAAVFKRPGGFGELSEEEAARLAMAGVDVHEPVNACAELFYPSPQHLKRINHINGGYLPEDNKSILVL